METVEGKGAKGEGTQGQVPPPPGSEAGRQAPGAPAGYGPPFGGWYNQPPGLGPGPEPKRSGKPKIVGILLIFSGILSIAMGVTIGAFMYNMDWTEQFRHSTDNDFGELQGQVIYMNSSPAAGANITIVDIGRTAVTNETGHYRILGVKPAWHDVRVDMEGYRSTIQSVYVKPMTQGNQNHNLTVVDLQLQPGTGEARIGEQHTPGTTEDPNAMPGEAVMRSIGGACMAAGIVLGVLTLLGGYFALMTEKLPLVAMGALCGIISIGFGLGTVFSIAALIVLLLSTDEFDRVKREKQARA